jgi:hypothetical protein
MGSRRRLIALACALASALGGCSSKSKDTPPGAQQAPPDRLAAGEAVEGKEHAFGLPLPRSSRVAGRFQTSIDVKSSLAPEQLVNFTRARVTGGDIAPGTTTTKLSNVTPRDDNTKRLTIEIRGTRLGDGTLSEMIVRDTTPPPIEPGLTEEQRWRKAGLTPEGKVADPKHLE